jgi:hypothetical protein
MLTFRRIIPLLLVALVVGLGSGPRNADAAERRVAVNIFVDTDIGVDDATAIAWLLQERSANILGFTTVSGNTTAENAAKNLLTLLDTSAGSPTAQAACGSPKFRTTSAPCRATRRRRSRRRHALIQE